MKGEPLRKFDTPLVAGRKWPNIATDGWVVSKPSCAERKILKTLSL